MLSAFVKIGREGDRQGKASKQQGKEGYQQGKGDS